MNPAYRHLLRTLLILVCGKLHSQTLTCQYNCPQIGEVFSTKTSSPVAGSGGLNQLWNFTQVQAVSSGVSTISYVSPSTTPSSSLFPQSNIAKLESGKYTFLDTDNSGVKLAPSNNATVNVQPVVLPLPFSYGSTYSETFVTTYVNGAVTTTKKLDGVGTGTLMLPTGTFRDVLFIAGKVVESYTTNGVPGNVVTNNFSYYYSERISHPLLYSEYKWETGPGDYTPFTQFVTSISTGTKNEDDGPNSGIFIVPNPSSDIVRVTLPETESCELLLINSMGAIVLAHSWSTEKMTFDLGAVQDGFYTLLINQGHQMLSKKLVVFH